MPEEQMIEVPRHHDVAEQFDDMHQQRDAATVGMWVFLATEVMFFGGLFAGYTSFRIMYPSAFEQASSHLFVSIGVTNTIVLLTSSLFVALAVHSAQLGHRKSLTVFLVLAAVLGTVFLGLKMTEYVLDVHEGLLPWSASFHVEGTDVPHQKLFLVFYWIMTAIHALHMIIGITVLLVIAWMAWREHFSPTYYNPVETAGLYWHFVDIVWIFLLPTFYLVHPHFHLFK